MREIKFRVWRPKKQEMSPGMPLPMLAGYISAIYPNLDDEIYLEYTGLKDKNGKEIYEGDILQRQGLLFRPIVRFGMFNYEDLNQDLICGNGFYLDSEGVIAAMTETHQIFEVIGNIYEHSHLLKDNNAKRD